MYGDDFESKFAKWFLSNYQNTKKNSEQSTSKSYTSKTAIIAEFLRDIERKKKYSELIIKINSDNFEERSELSRKIMKAFSAPVKTFKYIRYSELEVEKKDEEKAQQELSKYSFVQGCKKAKIFYIPEIFNTKKNNKGTRWNLVNIGADIAQNFSKGEGIKVAVVDTGVDYKHIEVKNNYRGGFNVIYESNDPYDDHGHGTHCSGIVCGKSTGVAPGLELFAVKVLDSEGSGTEGDIIRGLEWCIDNDIDIVSMSLGSRYPSPSEFDIIKALFKRGIAIVAAAGNEGYGPSYPAAYDYVIAVAAVDSNNEHADFSNIYYTNDISAPGVLVTSCVPGGEYAAWSGTSMATPHVAGALALLKKLYYKNPEDLEEAMKKTAQKLGNINDPENKDKYGAGLLRVDLMVQKYAEKVRRSA